VHRILIVLGDRRLGVLLKEGLRAHGHEPSVVAHPGTGSALADYEVFDLVIVDAALGDTEGFDMLRESCAGFAGAKVLLVDTRREPEEAGALVARARSLLDQPARHREPRLAAGGIELDAWTRRARVGDVEVGLTEREFSLLWVFLRHPGRVLSREELHLHAWGHDYRLGSNAAEVYVGYLRRKLGTEVIQTIRGRGYRLDPEARRGGRRT
jgi:DNA-binding response OmpR family regulator